MSTLPRLRPLLRRPLGRPLPALPTHHARRTFFTTVPQPSAAEPRFLPRFLHPKTYMPWLGRERGAPARRSKKGSIWDPDRPWNPATFFIWMFVIIGSNAINTIGLRVNHADAMRRADAHLGVLREVVERLGRGDKNVDVEGMLGTADHRGERDWEDVLREIETEDERWQVAVDEQENIRQQARQRKETEKAERRAGNKAEKERREQLWGSPEYEPPEAAEGSQGKVVWGPAGKKRAEPRSADDYRKY